MRRDSGVGIGVGDGVGVGDIIATENMEIV